MQLWESRKEREGEKEDGWKETTEKGMDEREEDGWTGLSGGRTE